MKSGIYAITNTVNGKCYIGSAIRFNKRWSEHRRTLKLGMHHSRKLQRAWNKYGADAFKFSILLSCEDKNLIFYEQLAIDSYKAYSLGYNTSPTAGNSLGVIRTEETKAKLSAIFNGRKMPPEHGAKIAAAQLGKKRKPRSPEAIAISAAKRKATLGDWKPTEAQRANLLAAAAKRRGIKMSPETLEKRSKAFKGRTISAETRAKISASVKGFKHTPEAIEKIRQASLGRKHSAETRAKMSEVQRGHKGKPLSDEHKAKLIAASTGRVKTESEIARLREANLGNRNCAGRVVSTETRAKVSAALKGRKKSPEEIANIKAGLARRRAGKGQLPLPF